MNTPVIIGNDGPRAASPEEIIDQGVRLYVVNLLRLIADNMGREGQSPPESLIDAYAHVVSMEVKAALVSGFDKAVAVLGLLREVGITPTDPRTNSAP